MGYGTIHLVQLPQGVLHEMLEGRGCIAEPKGHTSELIEPQVTYGESSVLLGFW